MKQADNKKNKTAKSTHVNNQINQGKKLEINLLQIPANQNPEQYKIKLQISQQLVKKDKDYCMLKNDFNSSKKTTYNHMAHNQNEKEEQCSFEISSPQNKNQKRIQTNYISNTKRQSTSWIDDSIEKSENNDINFNIREKIRDRNMRESYFLLVKDTNKCKQQNNYRIYGRKATNQNNKSIILSHFEK